MRFVFLEERGLVGIGESAPIAGYSRDPEAADRFAEETARLDLEGQKRGLPAWRLLGGTDATPRPIGQLIRSSADLLAARAQGIRTIKIKDLSLAEPAPRSYALRIDLNGRDQLEEALALAPELIEEPQHIVPSPIPLALDESLADPGGFERALQLIERGLIGALVLKPMLLGGFARCLELAKLARVEVIVTHMMDGPVGHAAAAHLAFALPRGRFAHGLGAHEKLALADLPHLCGGELHAPEHPGVLSPALREQILRSAR